MIVEWNNVSGGLDTVPIWLAAHDELIRDGYACVGVTAQQVGVEGGGRAIVPNLDLKHSDPERYGTLAHPGDSYSYDMYRQAGVAVRDDAAELLGGLEPKHVIAAGESQSAFRITTYIDAIEPISKGVYDGYLVYSRGDDGAALSQAPDADVPAPSPTLIRTDLTVPVMTFTTETDLITLGYLPARQPDTKRFRNWEVAGTAHADSYTLVVGGPDSGQPTSDVELFQTMLEPAERDLQRHHQVRFAVQHGTDDLRPPRLDRRAQFLGRRRHRAAEGTAPADHGRRGGTVRARRRRQREGRHPHARRSTPRWRRCRDSGRPAPTSAGSSGRRSPSTPPRSRRSTRPHAAFVKAWNAATDKAVKAGFVLPADAKNIKAAAAASTVGGS